MRSVPGSFFMNEPKPGWIFFSLRVSCDLSLCLQTSEPHSEGARHGPRDKRRGRCNQQINSVLQEGASTMQVQIVEAIFYRSLIQPQKSECNPVQNRRPNTAGKQSSNAPQIIIGDVPAWKPRTLHTVIEKGKGRG